MINKNFDNHWCYCKVDDVIDIMKNGSSAKQYSERVGFPITRIETISDGTIDLNRVKYIKEYDDNLIEKHCLRNGDILLSHINSDSHLGKTAIFKNQTVTLIHGINLLLLRPHKQLNPDFLNYQFRFLRIKGKFIDEAQRAVNQSSINQMKLKRFILQLAPLPEQRAIVAKIEQLLSDLDNGIANLKTAKGKLEIYRQAVLQNAFMGKLTNTTNPSGELPQSWEWEKLKHICENISDGDHQAPPKSDAGIPFITISNVNKNTFQIDFSNTFFVKQEYYNNLKISRKPKTGDILYTVTGSFGIPVLIDFKKEFCFQRHIGLIRPLKSINQRWLYYLLQSQIIFNQARKTATGTAQKTVSLNSLRNFKIPLAPFEEQTQIVQEIETRLSVCDKLSESIDQSLEKSESLRQSILKKAFEGKLLNEAELEACRQEHDWEPADKLLERIEQS